MQESAPLPGGNTAPVVRVGDTVRRVAGPWTPQVAALMTGLRAAGVPGVPEHRGLDEQGREVVQFVEGDVPIYPMPSWLWDDVVLQDVGRLVRGVHDGTVGLDLPRVGWRLPAVEPVEAAYRFVSLTPAGHPDGLDLSVAEQWRRVGVLCESYGSVAAPDVVRWAALHLEDLIATAADPAHVRLYERDLVHVRSLLA